MLSGPSQPRPGHSGSSGGAGYVRGLRAAVVKGSRRRNLRCLQELRGAEFGGFRTRTAHDTRFRVRSGARGYQTSGCARSDKCWPNVGCARRVARCSVAAVSEVIEASLDSLQPLLDAGEDRLDVVGLGSYTLQVGQVDAEGLRDGATVLRAGFLFAGFPPGVLAVADSDAFGHLVLGERLGFPEPHEGGGVHPAGNLKRLRRPRYDVLMT